MSEALNPEQQKKSRRELRVAFFIFIGFIASTLLQTFLSKRGEGYHFVQSLIYFALLHLNVILIMLLVFLVTRNIIKAYLLRRSGRLGSSLRWKMVTSLLGFTLVPALLLFIGSTYVIREGFNRWFGGQVSKALEDASSITKVHYDRIESNLAFFSDRIVTKISENNRYPSREELEMWGNEYPVESIELYMSVSKAPLKWRKKELQEWSIPRAAVESLSRAVKGERFQLIRQYGDGDLVQEYRPIHLPLHVTQKLNAPAVIVLSQTVPLGLKTRISELESAFLSYQSIVSIKDSLKTNYSLILLTLFLLILFVASWFGLYLAKSITEPVAELLKATEAFRDGQWSYRILSAQPNQTTPNLKGGTADLEVLKGAFDLMAEEVGRRGRKLEEANAQLTSLVDELEEREKYLEILLSSFKRGVLVLDPSGSIRRINHESLVFSTLSEPEKHSLQDLLGRNWREVFANLGNLEEAEKWLQASESMRGRPVDKIFEVRIGEGRAASILSVRATAIQLLDDRKVALGWLIILEDVSEAARMERLAAWQEVARRVAHEIKNPLTPIQISADRLQRRMGGVLDQDPVNGPIFNECVGQIQKQVRVIRDLVREFSQFAKLPEPKLAPMSLSSLVEEVVKDYRFTHPNFTFIVEDNSPSHTMIRGDAEYLRRLIVNLADNALHSMEEAKTNNPYFKITLSALPDGWLSVAFEDNGPGINASMREKIFDPYVTAKASGLGLGLAIVRRIAMEHQGKVRCEEAPGGLFVLEVPTLGVEKRSYV